MDGPGSSLVPCHPLRPQLRADVPKHKSAKGRGRGRGWRPERRKSCSLPVATTKGHSLLGIRKQELWALVPGLLPVPLRVPSAALLVPQYSYLLRICRVVTTKGK